MIKVAKYLKIDIFRKESNNNNLQKLVIFIKMFKICIVFKICELTKY